MLTLPKPIDSTLFFSLSPSCFVSQHNLAFDSLAVHSLSSFSWKTPPCSLTYCYLPLNLQEALGKCQLLTPTCLLLLWRLVQRPTVNITWTLTEYRVTSRSANSIHAAGPRQTGTSSLSTLSPGPTHGLWAGPLPGLPCCWSHPATPPSTHCHLLTMNCI
jgi:hypothetical protein